MSIFLSQLSIHSSWETFFAQPSIQLELQHIENQIGTNYTPLPYQALRFATTDLKLVKAIILGLDPYAQQRPDGSFKATGRSFEVNGVTSWNDKDVNASLRNVLKLLHKSHMELTHGSSIEQVRADIANGTFPILPPNEAFSDWESKGVLFLNQAFTVKIGGRHTAKSHISLWKPFFTQLLAFLINENQKIRYFLWGGDAQRWSSLLRQMGVDQALLYESKHPVTNGDNGDYECQSYFLNCPCFFDTKDEIAWIRTI